MIPEKALPKNWVPEENLEKAQAEILDQILFPESETKPEDRNRRWSIIKNTETGERALLRLARIDKTGTAVTAFIFTDKDEYQRVNNRTIRSIPLAAIELAEEEATQRRRRKLDLWIHGQANWKPHEPLGNPRETEQFSERVALQFLHLKDAGEERPVARMAEINQRPLKTVQGWVTDARKKGLLPPGRPGKAG